MAVADPPERALIEAALRDALDGRAVAGVESVAPWAVARVVLEHGEPATVVVKWLRDDPSGVRVDRAQLLTEQAALAFVDEVCPGVAPRLFGVGSGGKVLVLEDLQPRRPLLDLIVNGDPGSAAGLDLFARTL